MSDTKYNCSTCCKQFRSNYELNRHINKKNKCIFDENQISDINNVKYLMNMIKLKDNKMIEQNDIIKQQKNIIDHQKDKTLQLEKQIEQMIKISSDTAKRKINKTTNKKTINNTTNDNSNTINNTTHNTIHITTHGRENTDHITLEQYNDVFKKNKKSIPMFVKMVHFDENNKQNQNVYISNLHDGFAHKYEDNKWMIDDEHEIIEALYESNAMFLKDKYDDMKSKEELTKTSLRFDDFIYVRGDEDDVNPEKTEMENDIKKNIKKVLYNGRHIIIAKKK